MMVQDGQFLLQNKNIFGVNSEILFEEINYLRFLTTLDPRLVEIKNCEI